MARIALAFDVNETLLDLTSLDAHFERAFGDPSVRPGWFSLMLQLSFSAIATGRHIDFPTAQRAALRMVASRQGVEVGPVAVAAIVAGMSRLAPHPEVRDALGKLRSAGSRMATLTNSPEDVAVAQLQNAGLTDLFDAVISADTVQRLKPAPEPYHHAAGVLGVAPGQMRLTAAHWWDVDGAIAAGCLAAFVARPPAQLNPAGSVPDVIGRDLQQVSEQILSWDI